MASLSRRCVRRLLRRSVAVAAVSLLAAPALATTLPTLSVTDVTDTTTGTWSPVASTLNCGTPDSSGAFTCSGTMNQILSGDATAVSWSMTLNPDPSVSNNFALTNGTASTQTYIVTVSLPVSALSAPILVGGSLGGSLTDSGVGDGSATLGTAPSVALYTAQIDGSGVATLYPDPTSFSVSTPFGTTTIPATSFGAPIPSQLLNQGVASTIGISLEFTLSPGDSASFTSVFALAQVVPEPGSALLLLAAGALLVSARRRPRTAR